MRKFLIGMLLLPVLAGCAPSTTDGASQPIPAPAAAQPEIDWRTSLVGDLIVVELTDPRGYYRVERVELVGPAGRSYPAHELSRETVRESARGGGVGVGAGYSSGAGVGIGFSLPLARPRRAAVITRTTARLKPPDIAAYRQHVDQWAIRVVLTDPAGVESFARIPAPAPAG